VATVEYKFQFPVLNNGEALRVDLPSMLIEMLFTAENGFHYIQLKVIFKIV
jgi:hypothetical protein